MCIIYFACCQIGHLSSSYKAVQGSLKAYPTHTDSLELKKQLDQYFGAL